MGTLLAAPAKPRKVLWADDFSKDIRGWHKYLRHRGHVVVHTPDFESTAAALENEEFDLLILDQHMPRGGRKDDEAGALLALRLKSGDFGGLNEEIPFLFVTASEVWVVECDIDVMGLPGFLDIEEKADDLSEKLDRYLDEVPPRVLREHPLDDKGASHGEDSGGISERPSSSSLTEEWEGVVTEVGEESFRARLIAVEGALPEHEAVLPCRVVATSEQGRIHTGAVFRWSVSIVDDASGERVTESRIRFEERVVASQEEVEEALRRARERREGRGDSNRE